MGDRLLPWCGHCDWPANLCKCPEQEDPKIKECMGMGDGRFQE